MDLPRSQCHQLNFVPRPDNPPAFRYCYGCLASGFQNPPLGGVAEVNGLVWVGGKVRRGEEMEIEIEVKIEIESRLFMI
jgi:hypothetical protein